jgi:bifunctional UDP-N-acetylglucosamine pyrophosphorylase/glucosamine-1-phosphate N-acetyltransferase
MQAVILAAGEGTRLRPLTLTMSKPMVPLANKPMLKWIMEGMTGFADEFIIVIRKEQSDIIDYFGRFPNVKFAYQDTPLGTGHALLQAKQHTRGDFFVICGDNITSPKDMAEFAKLPTPAIAAFRVPNPETKGVLTIENTKAVAIKEKPENPKSNLINAGIYKLPLSIFQTLEKMKKSERNEYELTDALPFPMNFIELSAWHDITYPWDYLEANKFVLDNWGSQISKTAQIRPGAVIEEPVAIGDNAIIGPNCYIRAYSSIGSGCKVGNAVELKNTIIMPNTYVSHLSYVGDSIVGTNCNIAAGSIFANLRLDEKSIGMKFDGKHIDSGRKKLGAFVASGVKFGINCTLMPGTKIWPNLLIPPCSILKGEIQKQPDLKAWKPTLS